MAIAVVGPRGAEVVADVPCTDGDQLAMARLFFAYGALSQSRAKQICSACPAMAECLAGALQRNETDGVWGGTTPKERRQLRVRLRTQAAARAS